MTEKFLTPDTGVGPSLLDVLRRIANYDWNQDKNSPVAAWAKERGLRHIDFGKCTLDGPIISLTIEVRCIMEDRGEEVAALLSREVKKDGQ